MTGKDIILVLSRNGTALASTYIKSSDIQTQTDMIEKASATQQNWKEFLSGRKSWAITVGYLLLDNTQVTDLLFTGEPFTVTVKVGTTSYLTGSCLMNAVGQVATVGSLAQGTFKLQGNGALSAVVTEN